MKGVKCVKITVKPCLRFLPKRRQKLALPMFTTPASRCNYRYLSSYQKDDLLRTMKTSNKEAHVKISKLEEELRKLSLDHGISVNDE